VSERRTVQRTRILRNAEIFLGQHHAKVHCTLHDVTSTGARLTVASTYRMPETFELTFDQGRSRRLCRVKWHTNTMVGVAFETAAG